MAFQQSDLDNADQSIADMSEEVRHGDKMERLAPMKDRLLARSEIAKDVAKQSGTPLVRRIRVVTDSGW